MPPLPYRDRMFHVLVLGGIGLTVPACGGTVASPLTTGCGPMGCADGSTPPSRDGGTDYDAFPSEGLVAVDAFPSESAEPLDAFPAETDVPPPDAFPTEGPAEVDGGFDATTDGFPSEGLVAVDSGTDSSLDAFPEETAVALDGGS
jgi:hypothetical protein